MFWALTSAWWLMRVCTTSELEVNAAACSGVLPCWGGHVEEVMKNGRNKKWKMIERDGKG